MCGRARCTLRPDDILRACHRHGAPARSLHTDQYRPSYNVAPGAFMPVLRRDNNGDGNGVSIHCMKWGLIPSFTKKSEKPDFFKMFNARSESVSEKASFRRLLPKNRCLFAVEGFYEWKKDGSKKQPYYIHFKDGRPLVFAALYDSWLNSEGETLYSFTILTTFSSSSLQWLHDRMPVILGDKESVDMWLEDPSTSKLKTVLKPYESPDLVWYPVTPAIGKISFSGPECVQEIPLKAPEKNLISKFFSAKQSKNKESQSVSENVAVDSKEEPKADDHNINVFPDNIKWDEEIEEKRTVSDEVTQTGFRKMVKVEPFITSSLKVTSSVKTEPEEGTTSAQDESVRTDLSKTAEEDKEVGKNRTNTGKTSSLEHFNEESTVNDVPQSSKEEFVIQGNLHTENEDLGQSIPPLETVKEEPLSEEHAVLSSVDRESNHTASCKDSLANSVTKRDYETFSAQERASKPSEKGCDLKSSEKLRKKEGHRKRDLKSSDEKQSTLHWFFNKKPN